MSESTDTSVTVIGAGIIGICSACYLQRSGFQVTLIDREEPAMQTSFGNAGGISPGSVAPIGMPGMWQQIPRWLIDDKSPLFIRARHFPKVLPWLMRFISQSRRSRVLEISKALTALNGPTFAAYQPLLEEAGITGLFHKSRSVVRLPHAAEHGKRYAHPGPSQRQRCQCGVPGFEVHTGPRTCSGTSI